MSIYKVSNATQLKSALAKAVGGDRVVLASGSYGMVDIQNRLYSSAVTIESASRTNPAHFDGLNIGNSRNITISGLDLGRALKAGEGDWTALNWVSASKNIIMNGVKIHGSLDGNAANDGVGLNVRDTTNFIIKNSTFEELHRGAFVQRGWIVNFNNNSFNKMRSDGIDVAATKNIYIGGNTFKNFAPIAGDHGDAIQFWNKNEKSGSEGITIRDNVMIQTTSGTVQGVFMANANGYRYKNVNIKNNLFYSNDAYNGIYVTEADKVNVIGNSVLSPKGDKEKLWIYLSKNTGLVVINNIADHVRVEGNAPGVVDRNASIELNPLFGKLFANLNAPKSVADLLSAGYGYLVPSTSKNIFASNLTASDLGLDASRSQLASVLPVPADDVLAVPMATPPIATKQILSLPPLPELDPMISTATFAASMYKAVGDQWFTAFP